MKRTKATTVNPPTVKGLDPTEHKSRVCGFSLNFSEHEERGLDWIMNTLDKIMSKSCHINREKAEGLYCAMTTIINYGIKAHNTMHLMQDDIDQLQAELRVARGGELN